jgi:hypothetical protein
MRLRNAVRAGWIARVSFFGNYLSLSGKAALKF